MERNTAWMRLCATRTAWILAAGLAWAWRSEFIEIVEHCSNASLPARLSIYSIIYVVLAGLAVPGAVLLTVLAGPLFGTLLGTAIASFVISFGASLAFHASRTLYLHSGARQDWAGSRIARLSGEQLGGWELLMLRLLPVIPFCALNLVAGQSRLSLVRFWIVSQIGMLPATYLLVRLGGSVPNGGSLSRSQMLGTFLPLLGLGTLACCGHWWVKRQLRRRQQWSTRAPRGARRRLATAAKSSLLVAAVLLPLVGCKPTPKRPMLNEIYAPLAQLPDYQRNLVIVIPGVLGSKLVDGESGRLVWGKFERMPLFRGATADVYDVALPMREGIPLSQLRDSVRSDGTLAYVEIDVAGVPIEVQAYGQMLHALGVGGYRAPHDPRWETIDYGDDHFTCFQFVRYAMKGSEKKMDLCIRSQTHSLR